MEDNTPTLVQLYKTDRSRLLRLLSQAVHADIFPNTTILANEEKSIVDRINTQLGHCPRMNIQDIHLPRTEITSLTHAVQIQHERAKHHGFTGHWTRARQATGIQSPAELFRIPTNAELEQDHQTRLFGRAPELMKRGCKKLIEQNARRGLINVTAVCISNMEHNLEIALYDERRAIQFVLIKACALLKNYDQAWILSQLDKVQELRTKADKESITYYSDRCFETVDDPEWKTRFTWLQTNYKLSLAGSEKELHWLEKADNEDFMLDHVEYEFFIEDNWLRLGDGYKLTDRPQNEVAAEEERTKQTMDSLREKMRMSRLRNLERLGVK